MNILFANAKHEQRIVVAFSEALGSGAFGVSPTKFVVENLDGRSPDPAVRAALLVPGDPNVVELAIDAPMARGARFKVTATAVPASAGGTFTGDSSFTFSTPLTAKKNAEPAAQSTAADVLLYGSDLCWNGQDFQETATFDLEVTEGVPTVTKALDRRCTSGPLPWDASYGARARSAVDSPSGTAGTLRGSLAKQCVLDPRVAKVAVRAVVDKDTTNFEISPTLVSGAPAEQVNVKVQNG